MLQIMIGFTLDLFFGDPYWLFHPVRWIGRFIKTIENILLKESDKPQVQKLKGVLLLVCVSATSLFIPYLMLQVALKVNTLLFIAIESLMIYQIFATKCLDVETKKVYSALKSGDIEGARKAIAFLVSRDTETMSEEDIIKASIETIAENLGDGVIAPIFYTVIGGAPLGWYYKSVNTLDSMVGYKNDRYLNFGWASAKWDDVLNYIPARATALFILMAGVVLKFNLRNGIKMMMRDRHNHASPNSAYPESAAAGLLEIQLGGKASYFGHVSMKKTMGDAINSLKVDDLRKMSRLLYTTAIIGLICCLSIRFLLEVL